MATTRRSFALGAIALTAGPGATAITGVGPAPNSDIELIRLCAEFDAIERHYYATFLAEVAVDEGAGNAVMDAMYEAHEPLLEQIADLSSTTIEGATALAATLQNWSHGDFADAAATDELLARTLIEGLATLSPSAHLLRFKFDDAGRA